nr:nuclear transport factor 2 family protein [Armatimonas sp.]
MKPLLFMAAILLAAPAVAQDTVTLKKTLQAQYNKEAAAFMKKDIDSALSINTSDFTTTDTKGKKLTLAEFKAAFMQITTIAQSIKLSSTVEKVTLKGDTATVTVSDKSLFTLANPQTGKKAQMEGASRNEDTWVKKSGVWKRQKNRALSNKTLMDGKPVSS